MTRRIKKLKRESRPMPPSITNAVLYQLVRSGRRRSLVISIDEDGSVSVFAPKFVSDREIRAFLNERSRWIIEKVDQARKDHLLANRNKFDDGEYFLFLGEKYKLAVTEATGRRVAIDFDGIAWSVHVPAGFSKEHRRLVIKRKLLDWYRDQAKEILGSRVFHFSRVLKIEPLKIAIKSQKRIWGSCDYTQKMINLNWQIILSPMDVVDYVVVHELCHILVPDHSRRFWKKVGEVLPDYPRCRKWLRDHRVDMKIV